MTIVEYVDPRAERRNEEFTIVAQDPSVLDAHGRTLLARVRIPADRLDPGPRSHRFQVVDYDASTGELHPAPTLPVPDPDLLDAKATRAALADHAFHAQNVYAIAARTLAAFESALGRRVPWAFAGHQLYLVPHAFSEANAYYAHEQQAVLFGYLPDEAGSVFTCLSHDVIAHELTHALLDGLKPRFMEPGLPDQGGFHEAFADVVALLSVFSLGELVESRLGDADADGRIDAESVSPAQLRRSALFGLAEQLGQSVAGERASALRRSIELEPGPDTLSKPEFEEPHRRGEVLVAAVMQSLLSIWEQRLRPLIHGGGVDRARAAEEGAKAAYHLLQMSIRALDYTPPVEFEFGDFLDGLLASDAVIAPDDDHGYRPALEDAFARFGILRPVGGMVDLARSELRPLYRNVNFQALRSDPDEVFRFVWQNSEFLEPVARGYHLYIEAVRPATRVGPDGLIVQETVADYVQTLEGPAGLLADLSLDPVSKERRFRLPPDLEERTELQLWGGGTVIFDQFGGVKFHQHKALTDWERQSRRLDYLVRHGLRDTEKRFGFSLGAARGQSFAEFHVPQTRAGESW